MFKGMFKKRRKQEKVVKTGIKELDTVLGEDLNGELIVIGSRPGIGKTCLSLQILANQHLLEEDLQGSYIFGESTARKMFFKFMRLSCLKKGDVIQHQFIPTEDKDLKELIDSFYAGIGKFLFVDYLQIVRMHDIPHRHEEVEQIMLELKSLAIELEIPVFLLSQVSRKVDERVGHRPMLSDLSGSSAIEEIADKVLFVTRDEYYDPRNKPGVMTLTLAKNRSGETGTALVTFDAETGKIFSYNNRI